ncbi:MAG TPA: hypothetical protein VFY38_09010, partial [Pseudonocardia sp.]|nr:hypothetical protein [Pseudonocardia sp.]
MTRTRELFAAAPGSRPAVLAGLVTGVAVGSPLLVGVLLPRDVVGVPACLGAYVTAFTNKGGPRTARTRGLVVRRRQRGRVPGRQHHDRPL